MWRDLRPLLTNLFDDCNHPIYANFIKKILPIHNRLADGPSVEMIKKIKKLIIGKNLDFTLKQEHRIIKKNNNLYLNKKLKNKK